MLKCNNIQPILELKMNWKIIISFQIVRTAVYGIFTKYNITKYNEWLGVFCLFGNFVIFFSYCISWPTSIPKILSTLIIGKNVWILLSLCCWCLFIWSYLVLSRNGVWYVRITAWKFALYILRNNCWHSSRLW